MLDKYLMEYADTFGENFPIFALMDVSDDEIIKTIKNCLDKGKPYVFNPKNGVFY